MKSFITILLLFFCHQWGFGQIEVPSSFGKGIVNLKAKDSSFSMKVGFRMQILAQSYTDLENGQYISKQASFKIRRARLKFDGYAYNPKLVYKVELGLSNDDMAGSNTFTGEAPRMILDAVLKYNVFGNWFVWFGQAKLPGNRERVISSGNLQLVNRSELNSEFNMDREAGIQVRTSQNLFNRFVIREILSFSQGEGRNITSGNIGGFYYIGRIEALPFGIFKNKGDYVESDLEREEKPKLSVAYTYGFNQDAVKTRSNQGAYMYNDSGFFKTDITTWFVDYMFKYKAWSSMGEFARRDAADVFAHNSDGSMTGEFVEIGQSLNTQLAYLFPKNYEIAARFTSINYDSQINLEDFYEYTLGFSKYFVGHKLKLQSDLSFVDSQGIKDGWRFRLQMDLHF